MNWIKIITINFVIFFSLIVIIEYSVRIYAVFTRCDLNSNSCINKFIRSPNINSFENLGLTEFHSILGYDLRKNLNIYISSKVNTNWNDFITTDIILNRS